MALTNRSITMEIDPTNLTIQARAILGEFLLQNEKLAIFHKDRFYKVTLQDPLIPSELLTVKFNLSHTIVRRTRAKTLTKDRFEVIGRLLGAGAMGKIYLVAGTLAPNQNRILKFKNTHPRVVKEQYHHDRHNPLENLQIEIPAARAIGEMHIKDPTLVGDHSYTTMKYINAMPLSHFIRTHRFDTDQLIQVTINLLLALQRVHDAGIIHRDIKPDNILIDDQFNVTFIDYGLSKHAGTKPKIEQKGSPLYFSPEQHGNTFTSEASDLFTLFQVIGEMWRKIDPLHIANHYDYVEGRPTEPGLYPGFKRNLFPAQYSCDMFAKYDLSGVACFELVALLNKATSYLPTERGTTQEAIRVLENIKLGRKLAVLSPIYHASVTNAVDRAYAARDQLRKLSIVLRKEAATYTEETVASEENAFQAYTQNISLSAIEMLEILRPHIEQISKDPIVVRAFVETLKIPSLMGITNHRDLLDKVDELNRDFHAAIKNLIALQKLLVELREDTSKHLRDRLARKIEKINILLGKQEKFDYSIESLIILTNRFNAYAEKLLNKKDIYLLTVGRNYKQQIKTEIQRYTIQKELAGKLSEHRKNDINIINTILEKPTEKAEAILNRVVDVKAATAQIRGGLFNRQNKGALVKLLKKATETAEGKLETFSSLRKP